MTTPQRAKIFMTGRSQAVRIPKDFRLPGREVEIHRDGDRLVLVPVVDAWSESLLDMLSQPAEPLERPVRARVRRTVTLD